MEQINQKSMDIKPRPILANKAGMTNLAMDL
jgi:hypothetical protein